MNELHKKAILAIENFIKERKPSKKQEIKDITKQLTKTSLAAMLSIHRTDEVLGFLDEIKLFIINKQHSIH